jgi:hypothetical protein
VSIEDEAGYRASLDVTWYETEEADGVPAAYDCAYSVTSPAAEARYRPPTCPGRRSGWSGSMSR